MTPDQQATVARFTRIIGLIKTGEDGYALPDEGLHLEALSMQMLRVDVALAGCDRNHPDVRSALALTDATAKWLNEMVTGRRDDGIAQAWFKARAELIEPA